MAKSMSTSFTLFLMILVLSVPCSAQQKEDSVPINPFTKKYHAGIRLGGWINSGQTPPAFLQEVSGSDTVSLESSVKGGSFYLEGYLGYNVFPRAFLELSFGVVNRGSITLYERIQPYAPITDIGNLLIYPILLQLKFYPLAYSSSKFQPYVGAGGGLYYGSHSIQITTDLFRAQYAVDEDNETDLNYTLSAGADYLLSNSISLDINAKYMPIEFSNSLVTIKDYEAVTVTVGIKYLYNGDM